MYKLGKMNSFFFSFKNKNIGSNTQAAGIPQFHCVGNQENIIKILRIMRHSSDSHLGDLSEQNK